MRRKIANNEKLATTNDFKPNPWRTSTKFIILDSIITCEKRETKILFPKFAKASITQQSDLFIIIMMITKIITTTNFKRTIKISLLPKIH